MSLKKLNNNSSSIVDSCFLKGKENTMKLREMGIDLFLPRETMDIQLECTGFLLYLKHFDHKQLNSEFTGEMCNYIGEEIVDFFIKNQKQYKKETPEKGDLIIYFQGKDLTNKTFKHVGIVDDNEKVISKFCEFSSYKHPIDLLLTNFGDNYLIFDYPKNILQKIISNMYKKIKTKK